MKCILLISTVAQNNREILSVEVANTMASDDRPGITVNGTNYVYKLVDLSSSEEVTSLDIFLNNYDQFYFSFSESKVRKINNGAYKYRGIDDELYDRTIPYAGNTVHNLV